MEIPQVPRSGLGLRDVFKQAFMADPDFRSYGSVADPFAWLMRRSNILDAARQYAPGYLLGYGPEKLKAFDEQRTVDPEMRQSTLRVGDFPELDGKEVKQGRGPDLARRGAQFAGAAAKDATTQGLQSIWWFLNAPEAASVLAASQAQHGALGGTLAVPGLGHVPLPWEKPIPQAPAGSPITRPSLRFAAAVPLVLAASAASGTLSRQPGYGAVLPTEEDRKESADPITERLYRTVGRSGSLLPYNEFIQERPDVSRGQYESYKAFLHGDKGLVKFTPDGIHGAEVNFVGKSVPLLTGLLPLVGGVVAGRAGLRMAGKRLADSPSGNRFAELQALREAKDKAKLNLTYTKGGFAPGAPGGGKLTTEEATKIHTKAVEDYTAAANHVESRLLLGTLAGTSAGLGITGAGAMLLEQVRRARNLEENRLAAEEEARQLQLSGRPPEGTT
jgi:hypothetical protein